MEAKLKTVLVGQRKKKGKDVFFDILGIGALVVFLFPFVWLILTSFKTKGDQITWPPVFFPDSLTLENYINVFTNSQMLGSFLNTIIIAVTSTFFSVLLGAAASYSLSRVPYAKFIRNFLLSWFLITRMYPAIATAVPYYLILNNLNLLDTQLALIITYTGFNLPFVIWLMMGFFEGIPYELDEAATMDGCSLWKRFTKIILPISKPGIIATTIFSFNLAWNEFLFAITLTSDEAKTMPAVIGGFITDKGYDFGTMSSLGVLLVVPVVILSWLTQRHLVNGLTMGAVKE
jgi:multiple sugar transport system permease protein